MWNSMQMGQVQEGNVLFGEGIFERGRGRPANGNTQGGDSGGNGMMRINGQNYNTPSGKLDGLQREMIFSHFSDKHVIMEQVYESGKKVMHSNVFSNGMKISFTNENLPKKISFINPDYYEIASKIENLLYQDKVLRILRDNKRLRGYSRKRPFQRPRKFKMPQKLESLFKFESNPGREPETNPEKVSTPKEGAEAAKAETKREDQGPTDPSGPGEDLVRRKVNSLGASPTNCELEKAPDIYGEEAGETLRIEDVVLEGNIDDIANPKKGDGFVSIRGQEIFLEFEVTKNKRIVFNYMGKRVKGVKNMISFVENEIWGEESENEQNWERRLRTFKTTISEMEENEDKSEEEVVYLDILNSDSDDRESPNRSKAKHEAGAQSRPKRRRKRRKNRKLRKVRIKYYDDVYFEGLLENDYIKCHKDHLKDAFNLPKLLKKHREILNIPFHFSGNIVKGQKEGFCREVYEDGSIFEGFYRQGKRQGKGFLRDVKDSSIYMGNFHEDEIQGNGVKIEDEGDKLVGEFEEGSLARGVIEYRNGIKYLGDLSNGVRHGKGKLVFNNDYVFEGQFVHDQISTTFEKGLLVDSKQNKYSCTYDESSNGNLKFFMFDNEKILFIDNKNGELISFL